MGPILILSVLNSKISFGWFTIGEQMHNFLSWTGPHSLSDSKTNQEYRNILERLNIETDKIKEEFSKKYNTSYASLYLPFDTQLLIDIKKIVHEKKKLDPKILLIIGIGGSNLGTKAVVQALLGSYYNDLNVGPKIYFADTLDSQYTQQLSTILHRELQAGNKIVINVITKSGTTTETIANFKFYYELLKQYHPENSHEYIVATTDFNSPLYQFSQENNIVTLPIPKEVGGRYSIFSAVALFPLCILNIDIDGLSTGARDLLNSSLFNQNRDKNYPAQSAAAIYYYFTQQYTIHNTFLFSSELEYFGSWYRQLMGESIGKEYDIHNKKVDIGIMPTISIGSTDLHSVAQLYLGGPNNIFTTFINSINVTPSISIPSKSAIAWIPGIAGKNMHELMHILFQATQAAYTKSNRPFCTISIRDFSASCIGALLQFKMLEMMYLGYLLQVNPFDQPAVEKYKQEARRILFDEK